MGRFCGLHLRALKISFITGSLTELPLFLPSTSGREEDNGLKGAKSEVEHLISALCSPIAVDFLHCRRAMAFSRG